MAVEFKNEGCYAYQRLLRLPKVATLTEGCYAYRRLLRLPKVATLTKGCYAYQKRRRVERRPPDVAFFERRVPQALTAALWRFLWLARVIILRPVGAAAFFEPRLEKSLNSPFLATKPAARRRWMALRPALCCFLDTMRPFAVFIKSSFLRPPAVRSAVPWYT